MRKFMPLMLVLIAVLGFDCYVSYVKIESQREIIASQKVLIDSYLFYINKSDSLIESYESLFDEMIK